MSDQSVNAIDSSDIAKFHEHGYLVARKIASESNCAALKSEILRSLTPLRAPAEFEVDVQYPGAPADRLSLGGNTPRRLLHAYGRSHIFRDWSTSPLLWNYLKALMGDDNVMLAQCHHNCIMTKHPGYSSMTSWHQDIRYWRFDRPELVSVWLALGEENKKNGGLQIIPGSHTFNLDRGRLDRDLFLRTDLQENRAMIESAITPELEAGDVIFFHCRTFHAAGMNSSDRVKLSPVFTYHTGTNRPIPGTRSSHYPSIPLQD